MASVNAVTIASLAVLAGLMDKLVTTGVLQARDIDTMLEQAARDVRGRASHAPEQMEAAEVIEALRAL